MTKTYEEAMDELNARSLRRVARSVARGRRTCGRAAGDRGRDRQPDRPRRHAGRDADMLALYKGAKLAGLV
jgi:hypothetical protein